MRQVDTIVLATTNLNKHEEFLALFAKFPGIKVRRADEFLRNADKIGQVETFNTYLENAAAKARLVNQGCHYPTLADDSGLEVEHLGGKPGVRSRRYAIAPAGTPQDQANIHKLLEELRGAPMAARKAKFVASIALVIEGLLITATGELRGTIAEAPKGKNGFGYDSIFIPEGEKRSLAEMSDAEKNAISHRALAVDLLFTELQRHGIALAKP